MAGCLGNQNLQLLRPQTAIFNTYIRWHLNQLMDLDGHHINRYTGSEWMEAQSATIEPTLHAISWCGELDAIIGVIQILILQENTCLVLLPLNIHGPVNMRTCKQPTTASATSSTTRTAWTKNSFHLYLYICNVRY